MENKSAYITAAELKAFQEDTFKTMKNISDSTIRGMQSIAEAERDYSDAAYRLLHKRICWLEINFMLLLVVIGYIFYRTI